MSLFRRRFLHLALGVAALPVVSGIAKAESYPSRPVRLVVGFTAGGPNDIVARVIAQWLSERLGQPVVVENRPGGGSNTATESVVKARPDGHTLLLVATSSTINATLYDKLSFNFIRDIAPVATIMKQPQAMVVSPSVPAKTVSDLIAFAKANPGKLNMASAGSGTGGHLFGELFKMMAGIDMVHVPYRGAAPALTDLISGQVQVMFLSPFGLLEYVQTGKLRMLAMTAAARLDTLPEIPTVGEFLPGYEATAWFGIGAPKDTSAGIVDKLNKEINAGLADPKIKARFSDLGGMVSVGSPADFAKLIAEETEKWGKVVREGNIKAI